MGLSSSKSTQKVDQQQTGSTMPNAPDWLTQPIHDYTDAVSAYGQRDPNSIVAGASPLQQQAWGNVGNLSNWQPQAATAAGMAYDAGNSGPNLAGKMDPRSFMQGGHSGPQVAAPPRDTPGLIPGQGYTPAPNIPGYGMPRTSNPVGVSSEAATAAPASLLDNFQSYMSPYTQNVVDTTLAGYDQNAGEARAALAARGARNGAFGGSRFGIAEGQLGGDLAQNRAMLEAGIRDQGFNTAAGLSAQDAAMRQQADIFNAGNLTANNQFNAGHGNQMMEFNAGQRDNALNRQLQAAGLMTDQANAYDANTRGDLALMSGLGEQQRGVEQQLTDAEYQQLAQLSQLYGATPYQILVGQNVTGNTQGTTTTKQSPSLFSSLLQGAQLAAAFA